MTAIIKATNEMVNVYRLRETLNNTAQYYDADAISEFKSPTARIANKKQFASTELEFRSR